jgi:hypothetical protein
MSLDLKVHKFRAEDRSGYSTWSSSGNDYVHVISWSKDHALQALRKVYERKHWKLSYLSSEPLKEGLILK